MSHPAHPTRVGSGPDQGIHPPATDGPLTRRPGLTRRTLLQGGLTVLAGVNLVPVLSGSASASPRRGAVGDLARYRPVEVSSTAYAPTPGRFVVDGLQRAGVVGSGWRAGAGEVPQWVAIDLQGRCRVESVVLVFETTEGDEVYEPTDDELNPRNGTTGWEVLSSYATRFRLEVSEDGGRWTPVHEGSTAVGGTLEIPLERPVTTGRVRWVGLERSNPNPLGLNSIQVLGRELDHRPAVTGWTEWTSGAEPVRPLRLDRDGTVPLDSGWDLTMEQLAGTDDGAALSTSGVDTSRWLRARVPGTILASLVEQEHLPDPVRGMANLDVPEALSRSSWWYRRVFALPHRFPARDHDRVWLELDGINHHAEVWVDGQVVGELTHPSARAALDITQQLGGADEHVLAVRIDPMPFPGSPGDKGSDGVAYADAGAAMMMRNGPTYLAVSGWDWMPAVRDRVMGLWNHVRLRSTGAVTVGDPVVQTVLPDLPGLERADVTVTVAVHNSSPDPVRVDVAARLGEVRASQQVELAADERRDVVFDPADHPVLRLRDPALWWPNGYGEPVLHDLELTATLSGVRSDRRVHRVGLRQVQHRIENPITFEPGSDRVEQVVELERQPARYVRISTGRRVGGFGVSLWTLSVLDPAGTDLARSATATASSVDNPSNPAGHAVDGDPGTRWSSAYSDDQWIQVDLGESATVDRVVLVWETAYALDLVVQVSEDGEGWSDVAEVDNSPRPLQISVNGVRIMCRGGNWGWDELLRRMGDGRMEAVVDLHRDMNFTMIRNWLGSSNREELYARCDEAGLLVWNDFWNAWFLDPPDHDLYLEQVRDTVRRYRSHPCVVVWCGSNEGTPSGPVDEGSRAAVAAEHPGVAYLSGSTDGVVKGSGPYAWIDPARYFSAETFSRRGYGFHTEIGLPTVSVTESMQDLVGDEPGWPIGTVWNHHDWSTRGGQDPQGYQAAVDERFGTSDSLEEFCRRAQLVNFESMRAVFEAWNAHLWEDASGLLLWMSNPAWHSTVWQTYDYDLDVNGSYYGARAGCEPLHVQADPTDWSVIAVNHTALARTGLTVTAEVVDLDGRPLTRGQQQTLDLPVAGTAAAFTVTLPEDDSLHLVRLRLLQGARVLSENTYWHPGPGQDLRALEEHAGAVLGLAVAEPGPGEGRAGLTVTIRNGGDRVAPMVRLSLRDRRGSRVLPTTYSDNYLWLLPGEERVVTLSCPERVRPEGGWVVTAEGYGTEPVSLSSR